MLLKKESQATHDETRRLHKILWTSPVMLAYCVVIFQPPNLWFQLSVVDLVVDVAGEPSVGGAVAPQEFSRMALGKQVAAAWSPDSWWYHGGFPMLETWWFPYENHNGYC